MRIKALLLLFYLVLSSAGYGQVDDGLSLLVQNTSDLPSVSLEPDDDHHTFFVPCYSNIIDYPEAISYPPEISDSGEIVRSVYYSPYIRGPPSLKRSFTG